MIRIVSCFPMLAVVAGCANTDRFTASSMNFVQEQVDASCVQQALVDTDGVSAETTVRPDGDSVRVDARFNEDIPVSTIIRTRRDGSSEVSVFSRLDESAGPFDRRAAEFIVAAADENIYRQCTDDGKTYGDHGSVVLDPEEQE